MFTKQHYKTIAEMTNKYVNENRENQEFNFYGCFSDFIIELAGYFQQDNPIFDRDKFLRTCGIADN